MEYTDFPIDFHDAVRSSGTNSSEGLREEAERRIRALAKGNRDITGASVELRKPAERTTDFIFEARVHLYIRPNDIQVTKSHETINGALKSALDTVERQVREQREKLRGY